MKRFVFLPAILLWLSLYFPKIVLAQETPTFPPYVTHPLLDDDPLAASRSQTCQFADRGEKDDCLKCVNEAKGSWTVFGCLPNDPNDFAAFILRYALGIGGGIAFLSSIFGGFLLLTSAGDPQRINQGKEVIFYSIVGILIIIFSVFILELIGVQILGIPEFSR